MRASLRVFKAQPGFAATATLALGLCMAANSALFTVVNSLLFRPLPFPQSDLLVEISIPERRIEFEDLANARSIESAGAFTAWGDNRRAVRYRRNYDRLEWRILLNRRCPTL
jgi:hypothetical protein